MIFVFDDFWFDAHRLDLRRGDRAIDADTIVLRVLAVLVRNAGSLVSKEELVREVWEGRAIAENVVSATMARLRKVLGDPRGEAEMVKTVYGRGYRFARATQELAGTGRLAPPARVGSSAPPFVGREAVLDELEHAYREVERSRGRMCALLGEPGIGKTYAVEAFVRRLPNGGRAVWGFCRESGDAPPLLPWIRLLREVVIGLSPEETTQQDPALRMLLTDATGVTIGGAAVEQAWLQRHQRHLAFEAVSRLLASAGKRAPLVLVLEDLHSADAASLELVLHLLDALAEQRVMLVATLRHAQPAMREVVRARLDAVLAHRSCERITLQRLREPDVRSYVLGLLGAGEEKLARAVFRKSDGNPFYMAELVRQLRGREAHTGDALAMSDAALELVRRHVAQLDAESVGVLTAAAVIGRSFELGLLRAITGRDLDQLMDSLDAALAAEVLVAAPDSPTAFAFGHELFRAVLYDALSLAERRTWHLRVAEVLDKRARAGESVVASEVAHHLHAALPVADAERAVHYCRLAADAAAAAFANDEVVRHMRHALNALDLMEAPSVGLRMQFLQLIAIYSRGGSAAEYESAARELAQLARTSKDPAMLVRAGMMFNLHPGFKQLSGAGDQLAYALKLLKPDDVALRAAALAGLAVSAPTCFSTERTDRLLDEALPLCRSAGSPPAQYAALICALQLRGGPSDAADSGAVLAELDTLAHQHPARMPVLPVDLFLYRAVTALQRGDSNTAAQLVRSAASHARRLHHDELQWHAERLRALIELERDPSGPGRQQLERLHERAKDPGLFGLEAFRAFDTAIWRAELDPALQLTESELSALGYDVSDPPSLWSLKLRALASVGAHQEARTALLAIAPSDLAALPSDRDLLGTLGHIAHAAALVSARAHAWQAAERLGRYRGAYAIHVGALCEGSVPHVLGVVALTLGEFERAVHELEEGLARDEQAGLLRCAGYARLDLARALAQRLAPGDRERAQRLAADVAAHALALGLRGLARSANGLRNSLQLDVPRE